MMEIINGDLITAFKNGEINVLAHCCNRQNTFGSGIAKSIKERLPEVYKADTEWFKGSQITNVIMAFIGNGKVYNLYGQEFYGYGKQVNYGRLSQALYEMGKSLRIDDIIGIPYHMASDRAGGNWKVVLELVEWYLRNYEVRIYKL